MDDEQRRYWKERVLYAQSTCKTLPSIGISSSLLLAVNEELEALRRRVAELEAQLYPDRADDNEQPMPDLENVRRLSDRIA